MSPLGGAVTVAVLGAREIAPELGKKGTTSDLTLYNAVRDGHAATLIEPTQFPEKIAPLLYAIAMADRAVLVVQELNRDLAETVAALDLFEIPVELVLGSSVGEAEIRRAFKGTRIERASARALDVPRLRADLDGWVAEPRPGPPLVPLDHAFPVKGVGAVALGVVRRGTLTAHDRMRLFPTEKVVEVRSIQVHDLDVRSASTGERVGVALKGVEADELTRGQVLAPEGSLAVASALTAEVDRPCPYYRGKPTPGVAWHLLAGLQFVPVTVGAATGNRVALTPDRSVAFAPGDAVVLADLSARPGPRLVGRFRLTGPSQA